MMRHIWEKFWAALGIFVGYHRTPPTLSDPDHAAAGEGLSPLGHAAVGDEGCASDGPPHPDLAPTGDEGGGSGSDEGEKEDLLSALPDDILLLVLLRLRSAAVAARTCVLSRRWSRLWTQLPELLFPLHAEPALALPSPVAACAALALHAAPALRLLAVGANDADPRDVAAVLRLAAPRLTGLLYFRNVVPKDRKAREVAEAGVSSDVELPCFDRAEQIILDLGYLRLLLPISAVFTKLTIVDLSYVRFPGACDIGDAFSSTRCPSLRGLCLFNTQGLSKLTIFSGSLLSLRLHTVEGLQQLTVISPMLIDLRIKKCFVRGKLVVDIVAPFLKTIYWDDRYDPSSVRLGELAHLRKLSTVSVCYANALPELLCNWGIVMSLRHSWNIPALFITIVYPNMAYYQYLMEALTLLPVENLHLQLVTSGHANSQMAISCVFHFLRISTSISGLFLHICEPFEEQTACSLGCFCHQPQDWETEEVCLNSLQELHICGLSGGDDDLEFVKRLLGWTAVVKTVTINFACCWAYGHDGFCVSDSNFRSTGLIL